MTTQDSSPALKILRQRLAEAETANRVWRGESESMRGYRAGLALAIELLEGEGHD